jgi:hypothetical protein
MELFCDGLLALSVLVFLAGLGLIAWGCIAAFEIVRIVAGVALLILSPVVLLLWERLAWAPFAKHLSQLS